MATLRSLRTRRASWRDRSPPPSILTTQSAKWWVKTLHVHYRCLCTNWTGSDIISFVLTLYSILFYFRYLCGFNGETPKCLLFLDSRVQSYLLASLESSQHKTPPSLPGGLVPVSKELKELTVHFSRLVNYNKLVFSPFYQKIFNKILTPGETSSSET